MDALQNDSFIKKMILKLQHQCAGRGSGLSETLVALMVSNCKNSVFYICAVGIFANNT